MSAASGSGGGGNAGGTPSSGGHAAGDAHEAGPWHLRSRPEDFRVEEEPLYFASGEGDHTFVFVEKRGRTTEQVARDLARAAGVAPRDVGYAGRKDRHAITRQWLSAPGLDPDRALGLPLPGARVLDARRHPHKLRTGQLKANRFEITLRGPGRDALERVRVRARTLVERGLPNRFGVQRYGRDGDNVEQARALLAGGRGPRDRRAARFLISALQSEVFDAVLDERIEAYDGVRPGDLARVEASGGLFWVEDLAREAPRAAAFEISATGPIPGTKTRAPRGEVAALEAAVLARLGLPDPADWRLPRGVRARGTRRPLRVRPAALSIELLAGAEAADAGDPDGEGLRLVCSLPPGSYVTVLIDALVGAGNVVDVAPGRPSPDAPPEPGVP